MTDNDLKEIESMLLESYGEAGDGGNDNKITLTGKLCVSPWIQFSKHYDERRTKEIEAAWQQMKWMAALASLDAYAAMGAKANTKYTCHRCGTKVFTIGLCTDCDAKLNAEFASLCAHNQQIMVPDWSAPGDAWPKPLVPLMEKVDLCATSSDLPSDRRGRVYMQQARIEDDRLAAAKSSLSSTLLRTMRGEMPKCKEHGCRLEPEMRQGQREVRGFWVCPGPEKGVGA